MQNSVLYGAAVHVFSSQIASVLNIEVDHYGGAFALYYVYRDIGKSVFAGQVCIIFAKICILISILLK